MSVIDTLMQSLSGDTLDRIGRQLGTDEKTARDATGVAVGALLGGLARNASRRDGAEALNAALSKDHDGSMLDNIGALLGGGDLGNGAGILRHVLGSKQNRVAGTIEQSTGLDRDSATRLLTLVAPLVMAALGKERQKQGLDPGSLSRFLGQETADLSRRQPGGMDMLAGVLDADGDGDVDLGDVLKRGSGLLGKLFDK